MNSNKDEKTTDKELNEEQKAQAAENLEENAYENAGEEDIVSKLQAELAESKDKFLRLYSDFDNYKKRVARERIELINSAGTELISATLPILDDFERATKSLEQTEDIEVLKEGLNLIYIKLKSMLEQKGLKSMESLGQSFNTDLHDAITQAPAPSEDMKGKVIDENTAEPLSAVISLVNNETKQVLSKITVDSLTGNFELVIPHGGNYGVMTERPGYLFNSINFNLPKFAEYQEIDTHIIMVKAEVGSKTILKNIFFDVGKSDLKTESLSEIERIKELLTTNADLKVQINGHTDNTGNAAANKTLSLKRATAVVDYLVSHGIEASRLSAKGYGSERPIVSNDDEESGREINRRTEIEIVGEGV